MNPYEVLGLREDASVEAATERYNILVRKLKEANLAGSSLEQDRNHRLVLLRAAYDAIVYGIPIPAHLNDFTMPSAPPVVVMNPMEEVAALMDQQRYEEAIRKLDQNNDGFSQMELLVWVRHLVQRSWPGCLAIYPAGIGHGPIRTAVS
jgi:hypothetical protein